MSFTIVRRYNPHRAAGRVTRQHPARALRHRSATLTSCTSRPVAAACGVVGLITHNGVRLNFSKRRVCNGALLTCVEVGE
jgi:hypothetical protein